MSSKEPPLVLNMDDLAVKRRLVAEIGKLKGLWELHLKPRKLTRTLDQNAYWWAAIVRPFCEWLNEEWGERIEMEQAHEMLKQKILGVKFVEIDGQAVTIPQSSRALNTEEFARLIDDATGWLAKFCGIVVAPPEMFIEKKGKKSDEGLSRRHRTERVVSIDQASRNRGGIQAGA